MDFISEDKRTINLPVPLGTTVYGYLTVCCDACMFQKEKFKEILVMYPADAVRTNLATQGLREFKR